MGSSTPVRPVYWEYLGGDVVTSPENGVNDIQVVTMPNNCTILAMRANGGACYFELNGTGASANSPGFIADGAGVVLGPLAGLTRLDVYTVGGSAVHIMFFKEHGPF